VLRIVRGANVCSSGRVSTSSFIRRLTLAIALLMSGHDAKNCCCCRKKLAYEVLISSKRLDGASFFFGGGGGTCPGSGEELKIVSMMTMPAPPSTAA
jgi:hypothetical protein